MKNGKAGDRKKSLLRFLESDSRINYICLVTEVDKLEKVVSCK